MDAHGHHRRLSHGRSHRGWGDQFQNKLCLGSYRPIFSSYHWYQWSDGKGGLCQIYGPDKVKVYWSNFPNLYYKFAAGVVQSVGHELVEFHKLPVYSNEYKYFPDDE